jgi:hypothetical protein
MPLRGAGGGAVGTRRKALQQQPLRPVAAGVRRVTNGQPRDGGGDGRQRQAFDRHRTSLRQEPARAQDARQPCRRDLARIDDHRSGLQRRHLRVPQVLAQP